ncbi:ABC transporter ATP-binding protein [Bacillus spongiae]|uniref:ABC transporter ATP-binding protein n=1 Tax=Bacillus spongiae TaxID=2683610 RepID=A0ABU8HH25_9BACI
MKETGSNKWSEFKELIFDTKPPKAKFGVAVGLSLISTLVGLGIPLFTKSLIDTVDLSNMNMMLVGGLLVAFIMQAVASGVSIYLLNVVGQHVVAQLRIRLWKKQLHLPVKFYDNHKIGELISRLTNDTSIVKGLITDHATGFFTGILSIIGSILILLYLDWKMTLIMVIAVPLTAIILIPLGRKMYKISKELQNETATFTSLLTGVLAEIRLVKASNAEKKEQKSGEASIHDLYTIGLKEAKIQAIIAPLMTLVLMALLVIVIGYGGYRVTQGDLTPGDLVAFILYLFQIVIPISAFTTFFTQLQKSMGATERMVELLEGHHEELATGITKVQMNKQLRFSQVDFQYQQDEEVLKGISFSVEPGKVTAVIGPSGSGKTTIFSMIERFYSPTSGEILLDNQPIEAFSLGAWRKEIGYVPQESPILAGTIKENIIYGVQRQVSDEEIKEAANMAYADQFIESFPQGYDTQVGERGIKLSGGQKQRIGIARALIRNPHLLLLDEATSSLDSKSEIEVQKALTNLMKGRTTIVIAHRLSTVINADQLVFLDRGNITGIGTHQELYESHSLYKQFADQQLQSINNQEVHLKESDRESN